VKWEAEGEDLRPQPVQVILNSIAGATPKALGNPLSEGPVRY